MPHCVLLFFSHTASFYCFPPQLEGLPLKLLAVQQIGGAFSHTEAFPTLPVALGAPPPPGAPLPKFLLSFESSGKWPNELDAVLSLKAAFYLRIAALLEEQVFDFSTHRTHFSHMSHPTFSHISPCIPFF